MKFPQLKVVATTLRESALDQSAIQMERRRVDEWGHVRGAQRATSTVYGPRPGWAATASRSGLVYGTPQWRNTLRTP
jgi:hypothetical protein